MKTSREHLFGHPFLENFNRVQEILLPEERGRYFPHRSDGPSGATGPRFLSGSHNRGAERRFTAEAWRSFQWTRRRSRHPGNFSLPKLTGQRKSWNFLLTTKMVFPKSLKSTNSGSEELVLGTRSQKPGGSKALNQSNWSLWVEKDVRHGSSFQLCFFRKTNADPGLQKPTGPRCRLVLSTALLGFLDRPLQAAFFSINNQQQ